MAAIQCNITYEPEDSAYFIVTEKTTKVLNYTVTCLNAGNFSVHLKPEDSSIADVTPQLQWDTFSAVTPQLFNATVTGLAFGRTDLGFEVTNNGSVEVDASISSYQITVTREPTPINLVFQIVLGIMILLYNFGFGCKVERDQIKSILKRPVAPAIGAACQFLIMAPLSFGIAIALKLDNMTGLGLLAIGCSPGGGGSNVFAFLLNADLELSITLTFISTLLALGMTPLWMWGLGRYFNDGNSRLSVPIANVFSSLAVVVIPVAGGVILTYCKPKIGAKIASLLKPFTAVIGVTFLGLGVYVYYYALIRVTWRLLVACLIVPFCGYSIGLTAGYIGKQWRKRAITISLETGFQNLALALFMLNTSLEAPESDFAGVVPICYSFLSAAFPALVFIIMWVVHGVRKLAGRERQEELVVEENSYVNMAVISDKV